MGVENNGKTPEELKEIGAATRFGQPGGADPKEARAQVKVNPTSIRSCLHRLMAYPLDPNKSMGEQIKPDALLKFLGYGHKEPTLAMLAAIQTYRHGVESGKIMMQLIDQVDGKLIEKKVEATVPFSEIVKASLQDDIDQRTQEQDQ